MLLVDSGSYLPPLVLTSYCSSPSRGTNFWWQVYVTMFTSAQKPIEPPELLNVYDVTDLFLSSLA